MPAEKPTTCLWRRGPSRTARNRLVVQDKAADTYHVIRLHDIDWIEAKDRGVRLHVGAQAFWSRQTLADVERQLDPSVFMRIHRSRIVNRARITAIKRLWKGECSVILADGKSLGTGRSYQTVLEAFLRTPGVPGGRQQRVGMRTLRATPVRRLNRRAVVV